MAHAYIQKTSKTLEMNDKMCFLTPTTGDAYRRGGQNKACKMNVPGPFVSYYSDTLRIAKAQAIRQIPNFWSSAYAGLSKDFMFTISFRIQCHIMLRFSLYDTESLSLQVYKYNSVLINKINSLQLK
jgi:hypothetical protein